jgi:LmbE family N-acetylglucosaminyl deacetylase
MDIRKALSLPDLLDVRSIVCVQPHPDDNEVGAAGTLMALAERGCKIVFVTVTDGGAGLPRPDMTREEIVEIRRAERLHAGSLLGVTEQLELGFPDAGAYSEDEVARLLVPILREHRPELVMTVDPWMPYEAHPDHIKTGRAVAQAMLFTGNYATQPGTGEPYSVPQIAFYATSYPNTFTDVTPYWERKLGAILAHKSQFDNAEWPLLAGFFAYQAQQLFLASHAETATDEPRYAEAFKLLSTRQLHFFPSAISS